MAAFGICRLEDFRRQHRKFEKKALLSLEQQENGFNELQIAFEDIYPIRKLPLEIRHLPFADEQGIVLAVRNIEIPGVVAPYNASLVEKGDCYSLFFRYDIPVFGNDLVPYHSHIGCVDLSGDFSPIAPYCALDTNSSFSEDPRAIQSNGKYLVTYNDLCADKKQRREIRVAEVNPATGSVESIVRFPSKRSRIEKNWTPFLFGKNELHFVYAMSPHEIYVNPSCAKEALFESLGREEQSLLSFQDWPFKWGVPKGGTPARLVDGEYLSFFHSMIRDARGIAWYVMGAYTFEAASPFRITRISAYPILFQGIYETKHQNTANPKVRSIYPAGFVEVKDEHGRDLIYLSCGENDSAIKILTLDRQTLLNSLKSVSPKPISPGRDRELAKTHWVFSRHK